MPVIIDQELWDKTRSGARAGRGFRYQDAVAALLAVEGWLDSSRPQVVVPEGLDDVTLHGAVSEFRVQIKSRHDPRGEFAVREVAEYLVKSALLLTEKEWAAEHLLFALILERPVNGTIVMQWGQAISDYPIEIAGLREQVQALLPVGAVFSSNDLLCRSYILVEPNPMDRAVSHIASRLATPQVIARLIAQHLQLKTGKLSDENYRREARDAATLSAAEVQYAIDHVLLTVDPTALQEAVKVGLCELLDFSKPAESQGFYSGVDTTPNHVSAGLVFDRPELLQEIERGYSKAQSLLIAGPSGCGKSAAAWLYAHASRHQMFWYRVRRLKSDEIHLIVRLVRAQEATEGRQVGFVFDEVGRYFSDVWEVLTKEANGERGMLVLGTVREEDLLDIGAYNHSAVVRPHLDDGLAERIWAALRKQGQSQFPHWREPFDQSLGLLLEYTHLLTQGKRLQELLKEQMQRRLVEHRDDELLLLRCVSFAARFGAEVESERLRLTLGCSEASFARALSRLVDEHAIRSISPSTIGGLHEIRSLHIDELVRDLLSSSVEKSIAEAVLVVQPKDLALFILRLLRKYPENVDVLVDALAVRLPDSPIGVWTAAFHGLGLAACDQVAHSWVEITQAEKIEDRHSAFVFNLALVQFDATGMAGFERVDVAIRRRPEIQVEDLREKLYRRFVPDVTTCENSVAEIAELSATLIPLHCCVTSPLIPIGIAERRADFSLEQILDTVAVLREIDIGLAEEVVDACGGSQRMLERIHRESLWVTKPFICEDAGLMAVSANIRFISDEAQADVHGAVVRLCELLMAAVPRSAVVISRAVSATGEPLSFAGYEVANKRMERAMAVVPPARVAWNRAQMRAIQRLVGYENETDRAAALVAAVKETVDNFLLVAEHFARGEDISTTLQHRISIRSLLTSFVKPASVTGVLPGPLDRGSLDSNDSTHDFVTSLHELTNQIAAEKMDRAMLLSMNAAKLAEQASTLVNANIWRFTALTPVLELEEGARRLLELSNLLGYAHTCPQQFYATRVTLSTTSRKYSSLTRAATAANDRSVIETSRQAALLEERLRSTGVSCSVKTRRTKDVFIWPAIEYAVVIECASLVEFYPVADKLNAIQKELPPGPGVFFVPLISGLVAASYVLRAGDQLLPALEFRRDWSVSLNEAFVDESSIVRLDQAVALICTASAVCSGLDRELNDAEKKYLETVLEQVAPAITSIFESRRDDKDELIVWISDFLTQAMTRVFAEFDGSSTSATTLAQDCAGRLTGQLTDFSLTLVSMRIFLTERAISDAVGQTSTFWMSMVPK